MQNSVSDDANSDCKALLEEVLAIIKEANQVILGSAGLAEPFPEAPNKSVDNLSQAPSSARLMDAVGFRQWRFAHGLSLPEAARLLRVKVCRIETWERDGVPNSLLWQHRRLFCREIELIGSLTIVQRLSRDFVIRRAEKNDQSLRVAVLRSKKSS